MGACIMCEHCRCSEHHDLEVSEDEVYYTFWCDIHRQELYTPVKTTCDYQKERNT